MSDVAVVIPLHNGATTIGETLDSLARQTGVALELVVIDDRSTDGGPAMAAAHPAQPRLLVSPAPGISHARNTGIRATTAPYLVFLDADDLLLPGCLPRRVSAAKAAGDQSVILGRYLERWGTHDRPAHIRALTDPRATLLRGNLVPPCAALVPRTLLSRLEGPFAEGLFSFEDWDAWLRLAFMGARFQFLPVADCVYRMRASMMNSRPQAAEYALEVLTRIEPTVRAAPDGATLLRRLRRTRMELLIWRASFDARAGRGGALVHNLLEAARASPADVGRMPTHVVRRALSHLSRRLRAWRTLKGGARSAGASPSYDPVAERS